MGYPVAFASLRVLPRARGSIAVPDALMEPETNGGAVHVLERCASLSWRFLGPRCGRDEVICTSPGGTAIGGYSSMAVACLIMRRMRSVLPLALSLRLLKAGAQLELPYVCER